MRDTLVDWETFLEQVECLRRRRAERGKTNPSARVLNLLFRGDGNSGRNLETSLERSKLPVTLSEYFQLITMIRPEVESVTDRRWDDGVPEYPEYREWIDLLGDASKGHPKPPPGYEYLAYLRHHDFPSPLLDWSRSPYVAAYFAFSKAGEEKNNTVSIYVYWEVSPNKVCHPDKPRILSLGPHIRTHHRHFRQQSEYTYCIKKESGASRFASHDEAVTRCDGLPDSELDVYIEQGSPDLAWKFNLPATEKWKVLSYLDEHNLNGFTLFETEDELMETLAMRARIRHWREAARLAP